VAKGWPIERTGLWLGFDKFRGVFLQKKLREEVGLRVDFAKVGGFFCKKAVVRSIWAIHALDPTAGNGPRRGHVRWPSFGA
jgi:hypothetical protein